MRLENGRQKHQGEGIRDQSDIVDRLISDRTVGRYRNRRYILTTSSLFLEDTARYGMFFKAKIHPMLTLSFLTH